MQENLKPIEEALFADLGKQRQESTFQESSACISACVHAAEHLEEWAKPEKPEVEEWRKAWDTTVYSVPKGPSLIIS